MFHFSVGESTVTLQDVEILLGLRIDGHPIMTWDTKPSDASVFCQHYLGFDARHDGVRVELSSIKEHIETFPYEAITIDLQALQRACCLIAYIFCGFLFCDRSQNKVDMYLLWLLDEDYRCSTLSWGSVVLAHLYRRLTEAASGEKGDFERGFPRSHRYLAEAMDHVLLIVC
ncbi:protein MAIN-LIKE 2-like [Rutidosis leptorrhynchoides]|uniref:protein MAIN-LIKE 2-like n=1 Tax=Rutidosis leptorrhynchoides TaxID=125765 RepID=UPI003A99AA75